MCFVPHTLFILPFKRSEELPQLGMGTGTKPSVPETGQGGASCGVMGGISETGLPWHGVRECWGNGVSQLGLHEVMTVS